MDKLALETPLTIDHSPEGALWVQEWPTWDGIPINITQMTGQEIQNTICTDGIVKGLDKVYYDDQFENATFPSKAEVDEYHSRIIQHVRRMTGQSPEMSVVKTGKCLAAVALWSQELKLTTKWKSLYPEKYNACKSNGNEYCIFAPELKHQKLSYANPPEDANQEKCTKQGLPKPVEDTVLAQLPWSLRFSKFVCNVIGDSRGREIFGRSLLHTNFYYLEPGDLVYVNMQPNGNLITDSQFIPGYRQ